MNQIYWRDNVSRIALTFLFVTVWAVGASAQARIGGTVVDDAGKAIKAATVTAESDNLGQTFTASTDDKGRFTMIGLRPGRWRFVAAAPGYLAESGEVQLRSGNNANPPLTIAIRRNGTSMGVLGNVAAKDLQSELTAADTLFNQKRWDEAVAAYRAIMAKTPSLSVINLQIGAAYRGKGEYDAAIAAYRDLLRIDPNNEKAKVGVGMTYAEKGDLAAAEEALQKAADSPNAGRESLYDLAEVKFARGDTDESIKWYQKASAADPSWGKPLYKLGLSALKKDDRTGAAAFMTKTIAVDPSSPEAALAKMVIDQLNR